MVEKYIKQYAKFGMKRTNESFYLNKSDYLKFKVEEMDSLGCYISEVRTVMLSTLLFTDTYALVEINRTIVHEFGHALLRDCFKDSEILKTVPLENSKENFMEELLVNYFELLCLKEQISQGLQGGSLWSLTTILELINFSTTLRHDSNPMNLLNEIYPFREKLEINVKGLKKINLDDENLSTWLSNITGISIPQLKKMQTGET